MFGYKANHGTGTSWLWEYRHKRPQRSGGTGFKFSGGGRRKIVVTARANEGSEWDQRDHAGQAGILHAASLCVHKEVRGTTRDIITLQRAIRAGAQFISSWRNSDL